MGDTAEWGVGVTDVKMVTSGDINLSFDAGMFIPVTINGTTWHDLNANGLEEEGEQGLSDVTVTLYDRDGDVAGEQDTVDGVWHFDDMPPGLYWAEITPPAGSEYMLSPKPTNNTGGASNDFDPNSWRTDEVILMSGDIGEGFFDAGLYLPATIGDFVWLDETPNGIQDPEEVAYDKPVAINLYDELGYLLDQTESSASTGMYEFTGLMPATYTLEFVLPDDDYTFTLPNMGNNTNLDSDVSPVSGRVTVTLTSGEEKLDVDAGVMDNGPYYPVWDNNEQVCINDGLDDAWLEAQEENYLYENKEDCCLTHFWWRMNQCMANEEFKFYQVGEICDTKIFFEDWEENSGSHSEWTKSTQFDTVEECCANEFWYDYDGCVSRSPIIFKFEFCVDIQGLVEPQDCQSADIYATVVEEAINEAMDHHATHVLSESEFDDHGGEDDHGDERRARSLHADLTSADSMITKVGGISLSKVSGSTVCGGSLSGQGFVNDLTGTTPDIEAARDTTMSICGVITVEEKECVDEACLTEHFHDITHDLENFVDHGDLTLSINEHSTSRLPPVPELQAVMVSPFSLKTMNLVLPATFTGDLNLKYYQGSDLTTCMSKAFFTAFEHPYETLHECCEDKFGYNLDKCCAEGGGCPEIGVVATQGVTDESGGAVRFFPTWEKGKLCDSKSDFSGWELSYTSLNECCAGHFAYDLGTCMNPDP